MRRKRNPGLGRLAAASGVAFILTSSGTLLESQSPTSVGPIIRQPLSGDYVSGHIVVKFEPYVTVEGMERLANAVGATMLRHPSYADFHYVMIPPDVNPQEAARQMSAQPGVVYALPDPVRRLHFVPNDELYQFQWHFQRLGMEQAWDINPGGSQDVVVAVLDSGIAYRDIQLRYPNRLVYEFAQAPDLRGTRFVPGWDFVWDNELPLDTDGHGTHVAGTIAQTTNNGSGGAGMAFNVSVMPVKVIPSDFDFWAGSELPFGASTVARGIRFAVERGAAVINMSLGGFQPSPIERDALLFAVESGVFVAISAGNSATDPDCPNCSEWPAAYSEEIEGVMAVAALDFNFQRAPYSTHRSYVEIAAPGGDVLRDSNRDGLPDGILQETLLFAALKRIAEERFGLGSLPAEVANPLIFLFFQPDIEFQGTSMASPHVAGFSALLYDQALMSPPAMEAAIKRFATDLGPPGPDEFTGYGALNPRATLRGLGLVR